ncbi:MAG: hypothetical protein IJS32_03930, partial [Kiritimatiellae bacterium]|nr:hypothetical protein [Kiritimatiellia bacterium]
MSAAFLSPVFPVAQEAFLLAAARRETRTASDRDAVKRLAGAVARMGDRFTVARAEADGGDYFRSARDALAYALHFGPVAHAHLAQVLGELPPPAPPRA